MNSSIGDAFAVAVQADGKILAAGIDGVVRFSSSGILDPTFGNNGTAVPTTTMGMGFNDVLTLAVQRDGRILLGGDVTDANGLNDMAVARLTANGMLDSTFGTMGIETVAIQPEDNINSFVAGIAIERNGKIVAGGTAGNSLAVIRLSTTGQLDTTFARRGILSTTFRDPTGQTAANGRGLALALQKDGSLVVAGDVTSASIITDAYFAAVRLTAAGKLDSNFGHAGKVVISSAVLQGNFDTAQSVAITKVGVLITGAATNAGANPPPSMLILRLSA